MATLYHSLGIGAQSLFASRQGVNTTAHNIANVHTDGYSRQSVKIKQREPLERNAIIIGNGVYVGNITRAHDKFIEKQINNASQHAGSGEAKAEAMATLEQIYNTENAASISDELTSFFNSVQDLANVPDDLTIRTSVVEAGKGVVNSFKRVDNELDSFVNDAGLKLGIMTDDISGNLREIAKLNIKITAMETGSNGQTSNDLRDQRDRLLSEVAKAIDINYYEDQNGMVTIRGPKDYTLVDKGNASVLQVGHGGSVLISDWNGHTPKDVSSSITTGSLGGIIAITSDLVPKLKQKNNEMAYSFVKEFNSIHRTGFGLNSYSEKTGRNFFSDNISLSNAASSLKIDDIILSSNDAISAASSPLAPGDNVVANQLSAIKNSKILNEGTVNLTDFYADIMGGVGLETIKANHEKEANDIIMSNLEGRKESISGVSLDEEAMNLMKWQSNFAASSKVITTVDEMLDTVLSLKR